MSDEVFFRNQWMQVGNSTPGHYLLLQKPESFAAHNSRQQQGKSEDKQQGWPAATGHWWPEEQQSCRRRDRCPRKELLKATETQNDLCSAPGDACSRF